MKTRRSFFAQLATIGSGIIVAPSLFVPKVSSVRWKKSDSVLYTPADYYGPVFWPMHPGAYYDDVQGDWFEKCDQIYIKREIQIGSQIHRVHGIDLEQSREYCRGTMDHCLGELANLL